MAGRTAECPALIRALSVVSRSPVERGRQRDKITNAASTRNEGPVSVIRLSLLRPNA